VKHLRVLHHKKRIGHLTACLRRRWFSGAGPGVGAIALATVMVSLGCSASPEADIREAVDAIPVEKLEYPPFGMVKDRAEETAARQRLSCHDPHKAISVIGEIYRGSEEPLRKARALAAAKLVMYEGAPAAVRERVLELARAGLACKQVRVAFHGLRLLLDCSEGGPEDVCRVAQRLGATENANLIDLAYIALGRWGARDLILEQVFCPSPPEAEERAYLVWAVRTQAAVSAWACTTRCAEHIPARVGNRLVELMRTEPAMAKTVAQVCVDMKARSMVPQMKAEVYDAETPLATRVITGAAILVLSPQEHRLRQEFPLLLKQYLRARGGPDEPPLNLAQLSVWLGDLIRKSGDAAFFDQLWEAFRQSEDAQRADFLADALVGAKNESFVLHAISAVPDDELQGLIACSRRLRFCLRAGLLSEDLVVLALPKQGAASRAETEQRVEAILRNLDPGRRGDGHLNPGPKPEQRR